MEILKGIKEGDKNDLRTILESTGFFYDFEVDTALGLVDETCSKGGDESGYYWMKIADEGRIVAFATYGNNACSVHSFDLYWIAVRGDARGKHYGSSLLDAIEEDVRIRGGRILWIETSGRELYKPTEAFYVSRGYELAASLKDFYGPGDPKQVYRKEL
ncbi:MAG: GNAT family N-acetyltransferase [Bacteroidales bacterium]|nr:GNAT family N-acetyltransferase [Bacteroidales bacterium]